MTNTPMTFEEWWQQRSFTPYKKWEQPSMKEVWEACEQQNQAVVAELVEALKWALCMRDDMCDVHFEDELNQIKALLAKVKGK